MSGKITKQRMYCEIVLRMEKLEGKLDKLLDIICAPKASELRIDKVLQMDSLNINPPDPLKSWTEYVDKPLQWPNESYTDYLKRIGQLSTAQSDEEVFREECK